MRFVAKYAKYALQVRPQVVEAYATGATKIVQNQLVARFAIDYTTPEERALARQVWAFPGFYQEEDLVTIREPDFRISAFDSLNAQAQEGWTDEEREMVERALVAEAARLPQDLLVMEEQRLAPPWPTYDTFPGTPFKLVQKIAADGFDITEVMAYERENQNRDEVINAMARALEEEPDTTPEPEEELVG